MATKNWAIAILLLKILTLIFLLVSLIILATDKVKVPDSKDGTFKSFYAYRYLLSVDTIGGGYMLLQILLSVSIISRRTYFDTRIHFLYHQFFDLVFALFFATGVGAGFGLTLDTKKVVDDPILNLYVPDGTDKYFKLVYVSSAFLLMATLTLAAIILSSTYVLFRK